MHKYVTEPLAIVDAIAYQSILPFGK